MPPRNKTRIGDDGTIYHDNTPVVTPPPTPSIPSYTPRTTTPSYTTRNTKFSAAQLKPTIILSVIACALMFAPRFLGYGGILGSLNLIPIAIGGLFLGLISVLIMSVIVSVFSLFIGGWWGIAGIFLNFAIFFSLGCAARLVHKKMPSRTGAFLGLLTGFAAYSAVIMVFYFIMGYGFSMVDMFRWIIPQNGISHGINAIIILLIYKPVANKIGGYDSYSGSRYASSIDGERIGRIAAWILAILCGVMAFATTVYCPDPSGIGSVIIITLIGAVPFLVIFFGYGAKRVVFLILGILWNIFVFSAVMDGSCNMGEFVTGIAMIVSNIAACIVAMIFPND